MPTMSQAALKIFRKKRPKRHPSKEDAALQCALEIVWVLTDGQIGMTRSGHVGTFVQVFHEPFYDGTRETTFYWADIPTNGPARYVWYKKVMTDEDCRAFMRSLPVFITWDFLHDWSFDVSFEDGEWHD